MTSGLAPLGVLVSQAVAVARDTAVMRVVPQRDWLDRASQLATTIIALMLFATTAVAIPIALELRRVYHRAHQLLDRLYKDSKPVLERAAGVASDVRYVTETLREETDRVSAALTVANRRVQEAAALTEQRVKEFNALLAVVQREAEEVFVSTASTVRGVREGAAVLRDDIGLDLAFESTDAAVPADDIVNEEEDHGHDRDPESAAPPLAAAPRLRPRQRSERRA